MDMTLANLIPFPAKINPHLHAARPHLEEWVRQFGLIRKDSASRRFINTDFAGFAACTYPTADANDLALVSDCFAWLFILDDQLDDGSVGRNPDQVSGIKSALAAIILGPHQPIRDEAAASNPALQAPVVRALADLWGRLDGRTTEAWRWRFFEHVAAGAMAAHWEAQNRVHKIVPDEQEYIAKRRHTGAIYICMDLIEAVEGIDVPANVYASPLFQNTLDAACDVVCWTNDIYSLDKEHSLGEHHNLVSVVEHHRKITREQALEHVVQAIAEQVRRFIEFEPQLLKEFGEHAGWLEKYLAGMRSWMRGNIDWSRNTRRYRELGAPAEEEEAGYLDTGLLFSSRDRRTDTT